MTIAALAKETAAFCVACLSLSWEAKDIAATGVPLVALVGLGKALWDKCPERLTAATVEAVLRDIDRALPDARIDAVRKALASLPSTVRLDRQTLVQAARAEEDLSSAIVDAVMAHLAPTLDYDTRALAETALATGFRVTRATPEFRQHLMETLGLQGARDHEEMLKRLERIGDVTRETRDDLRVLHELASGQFAQILANLPAASRPELVAVAQRFEIDRAEDLTDSALRRELEKRAEDWRAMRVQIAAIPETLRQLSNLKGAAQAAFDVGRFDEVEELLGRVHEVELEEAAKTAELRAETALLRGRMEQAYTLLTTAADSFAAVDPLEPARRRSKTSGVLYFHGLRYGGKGLALAAKMLRPVVTKKVRGKDPLLWGYAQIGLGAALQVQGSRTDGPQGAALLGQAVAAYAAALEVRTRKDHPVDWAMTQNNLGNALSDQGSRTDGPEGAALLGQAVAAYAAALEVLTRKDHPVHWAGTQNNLGGALWAQGSRTDGPQGAALLGQAVAAFAAALEVRTRNDHPVDWAMTQENLGEAHESLANHDTCTDPIPPLRKALEHVTAALEVYDPQHMPYDHGTATALRDRLLKRLG